MFAACLLLHCQVPVVWASTCVRDDAQELGSSIDPTASFDFKTKEESAICGDYYREHAQVWLEPEQRLANGVSWRLQVDAHSKTRIPRITWMPDHRSLLRANRMLDRVHGKAIFDASELEAKWQEDVKIDPTALPFVSDVANLYHQVDVALTYASSRFASYREIGYAAQGERYYPGFWKGVVLDLDQQTFFGIEACPGAEEPYGERFPDYDWSNPSSYKEVEESAVRYFTFGSLLHLCDEDQFRVFRALAVKWAKTAVAAEDPRSPYETVFCTSWAKDLATMDLPVLPMLGVSGLALHDVAAPRHLTSYRCPLGAVGVDPVIIPYRELAPLMTQGPLRNELLTLH